MIKLLEILDEIEEYDVENKQNSLITQSNFDLVIIDEAHYIQ